MYPQKMRPVFFLLLTYLITWLGWGFTAWQARQGYSAGQFVNSLAGLLAGFSPLLVAFFLMRERLFSPRLLFGRAQPLWRYALVAALLGAALLVYLLFGDTSAFSIKALLVTWFTQCLLGGGMEEFGWRGYLQPALEKRLHTVPASLLVAVAWSLWHLPLWLVPGSYQTGTSILLYIAHALVLALALGAIRRLTGSILLCVLYHGFTNAIFMLYPLDMSPAYWLAHALEAALAVAICVFCRAPEPKQAREPA